MIFTSGGFVSRAHRLIRKEYLNQWHAVSAIQILRRGERALAAKTAVETLASGLMIVRISVL